MDAGPLKRNRGRRGSWSVAPAERMTIRFLADENFDHKTLAD